MSCGKIRVLDAEVIKRIAAGETLQRPVNAVKELLENSLDAGADRICIQIQVPTSDSSQGGLYSLSVTDNGSGISRADLELLCERHATSKLRSVRDLSCVGTYGFRGEALASCSQVSRVEVITKKRPDDDERDDATGSEVEVAWRANYLNGRLIGEPVGVAGNFGTTIHVRDLFYGHRVRREALQASSEEYSRIVQVVQAYALHYAGRCAFQLSRFQRGNRNRMDVQSGLGDDAVRVIKGGWGEGVGGSVLRFEIGAEEGLGIEGGSGGWASRTTFHGLKSAQVIIFLNGRLIEHAMLRRALLQAFSNHLPTSPPAYPFIYVDLRVAGQRVDVNVHPSKRQVVFMDEAGVVGRVVEAVEEGVLKRQYQSQPLNPIIINNRDRESDKDKDSEHEGNNSSKKNKMNDNNYQSRGGMSKISSLYPSQRVLTDHLNHRIDTFLFHSNQQGSATAKEWSPLHKIKTLTRDIDNNSDAYKVDNNSDSYKVDTGRDDNVDNNSDSYKVDNSRDAYKGDIKLNNIMNNKDDSENNVFNNKVDSENNVFNNKGDSENNIFNNKVDCENNVLNKRTNSNLLKFKNQHSEANEQMSWLLRKSLVVGLIDSRWCLMQSGTNLLLCDMKKLNCDLFYSLLVDSIRDTSHDNGNVFVVDYVIREAFEDESDGREAEVILEGVKDALNSLKMKMIVSGGLILKSLPVVLAGQRSPSRTNLRTFIQRLCLVPDYSKSGWESLVLRELSTLYAFDSELDDDWEAYLRHVILPAYRDPRARYYDSTSIKIITNTETLYKSFERC